MKYGLLLPHFGEEADRDKLLKGSKRVPGILVAVVGATVVVGVLDLAARAGVSVLGALPQGLPAFAIPRITYGDIGPVLIGPGQALTPVTLSFEDVNHDGHPDLVIHVEESTFIFLNQEVKGVWQFVPAPNQQQQ